MQFVYWILATKIACTCCSIRRNEALFRFQSSVEAKRSRRSPSTSRSHSDDDAASNFSGFAAVDDSDAERAKQYNVSEDIRNKVEMFFSLKKTAENFQKYLDFAAADSQQTCRLSRKMPFNDPDVASLNA